MEARKVSIILIPDFRRENNEEWPAFFCHILSWRQGIPTACYSFSQRNSSPYSIFGCQVFSIGAIRFIITSNTVMLLYTSSTRKFFLFFVHYLAGQYCVIRPEVQNRIRWCRMRWKIHIFRDLWPSKRELSASKVEVFFLPARFLLIACTLTMCALGATAKKRILKEFQQTVWQQTHRGFPRIIYEASIAGGRMSARGIKGRLPYTAVDGEIMSRAYVMQAGTVLFYPSIKP